MLYYDSQSKYIESNYNYVQDKIVSDALTTQLLLFMTHVTNRVNCKFDPVIK